MIAIVRSLASTLLKFFFGNKVVAKPYAGTQKMLHYAQAQHLMFAFKGKVSYESIIQQKVKSYCHGSKLIFDIGGNIGQYALLFSELVEKNGKVISLEPDSNNFSFLQLNIETNKIDNVICLNKGISDSNGFIEFYRDTETGGRKGSFNKSFVGQNFRGYTEKVETITLDNLIEQYGEPQFVKIDVEGFEHEVVKGLTKKMNDTVFLIEVREETKQLVFDYFKARSYRCMHIDNKKDYQIESSEQIPAFANLIFRKS